MLSQVLATFSRVSVAEFAVIRDMLAVAHIPTDPKALAWIEPARPCKGCDGSGSAPSQKHPGHYGVCAACKGTGAKAPVNVTAMVALKELIARMRKDTCELSDASWLAWVALPVQTRSDACLAVESAHGAFGDSVRKALRLRGRLTPAQVAALLKPAPKNSSPAVQPLTAGRQPLKGTVVSLKEQSGQYGIQLKMLLRLESGSRVFGTVPAKIANTVKPGDAVSIVANVQPKESDFGFFSRPACA